MQYKHLKMNNYFYDVLFISVYIGIFVYFKATIVI